MLRAAFYHRKNVGQKDYTKGMALMNRILAIGFVALMACDQASAQTLTTAPFNQPPPAGASVVNFDSPLPSGFSLNGGTIIQGSIPTSASPAGNSTKYLSLATGQTALVTADRDYSTGGFYWGSIDTYNFVNFLDAAGNIIAGFTGAEIPPANGNQVSGDTNRYVSFTSAGAGIRSIAFRSTGIAFEVDDVAFSGVTGGSPAPVPEPATMGLFALGGGMLLARSRRRKAAGAA
jgi:hypothetical protein